MTVRRKNLAGHYGLIGIHGIMLIAGATIGRYELNEAGTTARMVALTPGGLAAMIRMGPWPAVFQPLQNKYVLWTPMAAMMQGLCPLIQDENAENAILTYDELWYLHKFSSVGVFVIGYYNCAYAYNNGKQAKEGGVNKDLNRVC